MQVKGMMGREGGGGGRRGCTMLLAVTQAGGDSIRFSGLGKGKVNINYHPHGCEPAFGGILAGL